MLDQPYDQGGFSFSADGRASSSANDPLWHLFEQLIERAFLTGVGVYDSQVYKYLADVLTDFAHVKRLYKVRTLAGRPISEIADMLAEASVGMNATSFNREREVHKHIGDFALFWTGLYPEALPRLQSACRKDQLIDYVAQGKSSYAIAASHNYGAYRDEAQVLRRLSDDFEVCMYGLNIVRREMDRLPHRLKS
jgi:hypothetical protein